MSPVWWEAHLSGMNYFCVHMIVFIPPNRDLTQAGRQRDDGDY